MEKVTPYNQSLSPMDHSLVIPLPQRTTFTQTMRWRGKVKNLTQMKKLEKRQRNKVAKITMNRRKRTTILGNLY